jgi:molybdopterin converting factor small subunit
MPEVRILGPLRDALGAASLRMPPGSAGEILRGLAARGGPALADRLFADPAAPGAQAERDLHVLVNGRSIEHLDGLATPVRESDVVTVYRMGARGWPGG